MPFQFRAEVAVAALRKALPAAGHLVGFASAHVQLRLEATLAHLCSKLGAACYEPTVKIIFSELVRSIEWALLHGFSLRSFSQADASAVAKDVDALRDYFAAEFDVALIKERSASLEEILALMEMATDSLVRVSSLSFSFRTIEFFFFALTAIRSISFVLAHMACRLKPRDCWAWAPPRRSSRHASDTCCGIEAPRRNRLANLSSA